MNRSSGIDPRTVVFDAGVNRQTPNDQPTGQPVTQPPIPSIPLDVLAVLHQLADLRYTGQMDPHEFEARAKHLTEHA